MPARSRCRRSIFSCDPVRRLAVSAGLALLLGCGAIAASVGLLPAKVVRQYALTSANDFPQRDPFDWQLLGSNDGGRTWTILDVRKGVIFSQRHQRKLFKMPNQAAFNMYRLAIERVREPSEANSVQLAEIEPLGETEDDFSPAPIFADRITVQGENPNLEKAASVFDGLENTKWLDYADQNPGTRASWIEWQYTDHSGLVISNIVHLIQLRTQASQGYAVRIEGWLVGQLDASNQWCVMDGSGDLAVPVSSPQPWFSPGQRVRVEGISQATGQRAGIARARFTQLSPAKSSVPVPVAAEEPLSPAEEMTWGQVDGEVRFVGCFSDGLNLELADNGHVISVRVLHGAPSGKLPTPGTRVQVSGICQGVLDSAGQRVAGIVWAASLDAISPLKRAQPAAGSLTNSIRFNPGNSNALALTTIDEVRRLGPEKLAKKPQVRLQGVVTDLYGTYIQDETGGIEVRFSPDKSDLAPTLGDYVVVEGTGDWVESDSPAVQADSVEILGRGELPRARLSSWSELASGQGVDQWVEIQGVVHSSDGSHVLLDCEGEQALVTIRSAPASLVDDLVDATVRMRGIGTTARDEHQVRGIHLIVPSLDYVEVDREPATGSTMPTREISSLLRGNGPMAFRHRVKTEGVLTLQDGDRYFIQEATNGALAVAKQSIILTRSGHWVFWQSPLGQGTNAYPQFKPGDRLEVIGFPEMRGYSPVLTEAIIRPLGGSTAVVPVQTDANGILAGNLDSTLVSLEGMLLSEQTIGQKTVMELRDGQAVFEAFVQVPNLSLAPGCRVRVTGVCQTEPTPYEEFGKSVGSFKLLVGSAADLTVLQRPPWWDLKHTLAVTGALAGILAVAICWIGLLHREVDKRTTQLKREIEERKRIELEIEQSHKQLLLTSRLAGMAEVATHVLHNVGNVLNSVNLLGSAIVDDLHSSKAARVGKLADLLASQRPDLARFITDDPRGQQLPDYLKWLGDHLAQEQTELVRKVESLTENIQHIKEIVATQHNYAKVSGVCENVALEDIVEDALRMQGEGLARHKIRLKRDYAKVPPLLVDRHKVLQILFNLLQNARHACDKSDASEKQITVRIRAKDDRFVEVSVLDNGMGIASENLPRIFAQGFSTRKDGHGFGLHSSILTAQDMGGALKAFSEGPGKGATFVLELPVSPKNNPATNGQPLLEGPGAGGHPPTATLQT